MGRRARGAGLALAVVAAAVAVAGVVLGGGDDSSSVRSDVTVPAGGPPNVLLLVSDDQAWSTMGPDLMPTVYSEIVQNGQLFERAYVQTSLCCPSRSQILTGLDERHTGVDANDVPLDRPTIVRALHDAGYRTMLAGKYLNSEPCDPLPEFDRWVCATRPPEGSQPNDYENVDPTLNVDGTFNRFDGYVAQILADQSADFIRSTPDDQPFFLMYTPPTPHKPADDDRMKSRTRVEDYRPPSFDRDPTAAGQPAYMARGPLTDEEISSSDRLRKNMAVSVRGLDESVGTILSALGGRADNTLVVYLSDNGYLFGEHRLQKKQWPYEEAVRVPMAIRFPTLLGPRPPSDALVSNIDLAPTIMSLAGIPWGGDGRSLVPLLRGDVESVHDEVLISYCEGPSYPCGPRGNGGGGDSDADPADVQHVMPAWQGLVGERWKYVSYSTGDEELYDLDADPNELRNLAGDPAYEADRQAMADALAARIAPPPPETTIVSGPGDGAVPSFVYFSQTIDATYECRVVELGATWASCPRQEDTIQGLAPGTYTFEVRATDATGATDDSPARRGFTVET